MCENYTRFSKLQLEKLWKVDRELRKQYSRFSPDLVFLDLGWELEGVGPG